MKWKFYRDIDDRKRIRKIVIELWDGRQLRDRTRMFAGFFLEQRLKRRKKHMLRRGLIFAEIELSK